MTRPRFLGTVRVTDPGTEREILADVHGCLVRGSPGSRDEPPSAATVEDLVLVDPATGAEIPDDWYDADDVIDRMLDDRDDAPDRDDQDDD